MARPYLDIIRKDRDTGKEVKIRLRGNTCQYGDIFVDLYRIGQLAKVVGRLPSTIRSWEATNARKGLKSFPRPMWKIETTNKFLHNPSGKAVERFYSTAQIELIDYLVLKYNVYYQGQSKSIDPRFFEELHDQFYKVDELEEDNEE